MRAARLKVVRAPWLHRCWCDFCLHRHPQHVWERIKETQPRWRRPAANRTHSKRLHHRQYRFSLSLGCLEPWIFWKDEGAGARDFFLRLNTAIPQLWDETYRPAEIESTFIVYEARTNDETRAGNEWSRECWNWRPSTMDGRITAKIEIFVCWFLGSGPTLRVMGTWSWENLANVMERKCAN